MTTIAWDGKTLAADTLVSRNDAVSGYSVKAFKRGPVLAASCGSMALGQRFRDWFRSGMQGDVPLLALDDDSACAIIIHDGRIIEWSGQQVPDVVAAPFAAWGSGAPYALGAMAAGATAEEAVRAAMMLDHHTGGEITVLSP